MNKRIPKYLSSKWIKALNKKDLYMRSHLDIEFNKKQYKVYLERYELDGFWTLLPHAILFVYDKIDREVCRIGYDFNNNQVTWTTSITELETA
jgi:hypothetical protein